MIDIGVMDEIDVMSRMLELGGTMLAEHCQCGAPMFRYRGQVGCPICDFKMVQSEAVTEEKVDRNRKEQNGIAKIAPSGLGHTISEKIVEIASEMREETDLGRVRDQMDCIERGVRILGMLGSDRQDGGWVWER